MIALQHSSVDSSAMRGALGHFPTGVVIVTGTNNGAPVGITLQSFVSLSLDPPLILLSPARTSSTWPLIAESGRFVVNVLAHEQGELARQFARSGVDRFEGVPVTNVADLGGAIIDGAVAWIDCTVVNEFDGGDHTIIVAAVNALECISRDGEIAQPLVFHKSSFRTLVD